jgi:drug/metabolite transporter (DMT)-like permease
MPNSSSSRARYRVKATLMLVLCTAFWSLSFPTMRALALYQQQAMPDRSSWFISALCVGVRFGLAAVLVAFFCLRTIRNLTRSEIWEGFGLGVFGGVGILIQMDGLSYTSASTSAFLTQCYCLIIPVWIALRHRRWPSVTVTVSCLIVMVGVAILSQIDWKSMRLGRGEFETILASIVFTGQILWLQKPEFQGNNVWHFTLVMFVVMAALNFPVALVANPNLGEWVKLYSHGPTLLFMAILVVFCTMGGYLLMNRWQPYVSATQAGLIYCAEPIFASFSALFLPGYFSNLARIEYPNEVLTNTLLLGGGLITFANILIQFEPAQSSAATSPDPQVGDADQGS